MPIFEERLVFHLLNYDQDVPHIPFHTRRKPIQWHYYDEPTDLGDGLSQHPLDYYLHRRPNTLEWDLQEAGQLLLRENELDSHLLDHHIRRRPKHFHYDVLHGLDI